MKPVVLRLGLSALGGLCALTVGEACVRAVTEGQYAPREAFFRADDELGWAPAPNLDERFHGGDFTMRIRTDGFGARLCGDEPVPSEAGRVVLIGDSYTFGWGVDDEQTYAAELDRHLREASGGALRVVNLGVGGYGLAQSELRLRRWVSQQESVRVRALVLLHSHNDMYDDVQFQQVLRGLRTWLPAPPNESWLHTWNLVRRALARSGAARPSVDVLFGVRVVDARPPRDEEERALLEEEQTQRATLARGSLSALQRELMRAAIADLHATAVSLDAPVLHAVIHSAPPWYVTAVEELVETAKPQGARVLFLGRIPDLAGFQGPLENEHSGRHFTPALNRRYAATVARALQALDGN